MQLKGNMERFWEKKPKKNLNLTSSQIYDSSLRGQERGIREKDETAALSHLFAVARRKIKLSVSELSEKSGVSENDIIDLELRQFHRYQSAEVAEKLNGFLNIDEDKYRKSLLI